MAIAGGKRWERIIAALAHPFCAGESKAFGAAEHAEAWDRLRQE